MSGGHLVAAYLFCVGRIAMASSGVSLPYFLTQGFGVFGLTFAGIKARL